MRDGTVRDHTIGHAIDYLGVVLPVHGLIPPLRVLYDYSWVVGLVAAFLCYWLLAVLLRAGRRQSRGQEEIAAQPATR